MTPRVWMLPLAELLVNGRAKTTSLNHLKLKFVFGEWGYWKNAAMNAVCKSGAVRRFRWNCITSTASRTTTAWTTLRSFAPTAIA